MNEMEKIEAQEIWHHSFTALGAIENLIRLEKDNTLAKASLNTILRKLKDTQKARLHKYKVEACDISDYLDDVVSEVDKLRDILADDKTIDAVKERKQLIKHMNSIAIGSLCDDFCRDIRW